MYIKIIKILFFVLISSIFSYAQNNSTTSEFSNIKLQIQFLELNNKNINSNQEQQIIKIQNDIKNIENKINTQSINKIKITKDLEIFNIKIENISFQLTLFEIIIAVIGVLITIITVAITIRNEGSAKAIASSEIDKWLKEKADIELKTKFDDLLNEINLQKNTILDDIKKEANTLHLEYRNKLDKLDFNNYSQNDLDDLNNKVTKIENENEKSRTFNDWYDLFLNDYLNKNYEIAIEYMQKAIDYNLNKDLAYFNMGNAYNKLKEYEKAIQSYEQAIKINPKNDSAYSNMGIAYAKLKEYEKAIQSYEQAIKINPKNDSAYSNMGIAYAKLKEYEKAIQSYEQAIKINPKNDSAYTNLFEISLIQNINFGKLESTYIDLFKHDKKIFMQYEMLKILQDISKNKNINIEQYLSKYENYNLSSWSFDPLEEWANKKDEKIKNKLLDAISRFKTKL